MKSTAEIIKQMEKEFDELFVGEKSYPRKGLYTERIRVFYKDFFRTLLESFGEEIVGKDEDDSNYCRDQNRHYSREYIVKAQNSLRAEQRLKMKEIIENIKL